MYYASVYNASDGVGSYWLSVWVTMPERPKGVKDKVKRSEKASS